MKNPIIITSPKDIHKEKWDELIKVHPQGNFFQSSIYFDFLSTVTTYEPFIIAAKDKNNNDLLGILQGTIQKEKGVKGYFSRRAIVIGGPLIKNDDSTVCSLILKHTSNFLKYKVIYLEFRNLFDLSNYHNSFEKQGFTYKAHLNFLVLLNSLELARKGISKSKLRQIKKSLENGLNIREASSLFDVEQFYEILQALYKTKIRKPLPDWSFFEKFFLNAIGVFLLVEYEGKIVGGIMCPIDKHKIYEWYICGLDNSPYEIYPSVVATYAAIKYGVEKNLQFFDFLGAGSPDSDYGVREFKARFGGELVEYGRYIKIYNKLLYMIGKLGLLIMSFFKKH